MQSRVPATREGLILHILRMQGIMPNAWAITNVVIHRNTTQFPRYAVLELAADHFVPLHIAVGGEYDPFLAHFGDPSFGIMRMSTADAAWSTILIDHWRRYGRDASA